VTGEPRPLLALGTPEVGERFRQPNRNPPRLNTPSTSRQGERLTPQFQALVEAFDAERVVLSDGQVDEVDPELVLVFDLAGSVQEFRNAIQHVDGLEFLSEFLDEDTEPDDDFHMSQDGARTDRPVQHSLYLVMSNATAVTQMVSLFRQWEQDRDITFERGLGRFKAAFSQLRAIRRWAAEDRIRDTGLLDVWRERLAVAGQSISTLPIEVELWYRRGQDLRTAAEQHLTGLIADAGGRVLNRAEIGDIGYHALLAEIPVQQVSSILRDGASAVDLLNADEIMFVNPYTPMSVAGPGLDPTSSTEVASSRRIEGLPRIALLDGLPFANHETLAGRLVIDDPEDLGPTYPVTARHHGTAMASLVVHGDLSRPGEPIRRPLYVQPILQPHPIFARHEIVLEGQLLTDILHRAIRRIVEGDGAEAAAAPSVRIVNLSIGAESRALVRRMSPLGRLLDWLAVKYNLLFVVSAGNHFTSPITIPAQAARSVETACVEAVKAVRATSRLRGILPPGDAMNAVTVGATHADDGADHTLSDSVWDLLGRGAPALYGAVGPGVGRSIKPDIYHAGGRVLYERPVVPDSATDQIVLTPARTWLTGPGLQVAAPKSGGVTDATVFTHGTSNAAALVTREADAIFDALEAGSVDADAPAFPDALYHPVLAKALLVHASTWGEQEDYLRDLLALDTNNARRELTALLGYGSLRRDRITRGATNRAVLIAGASIGRNQQHTYNVPLPGSLRAKAEWHRFTVTLASFIPTVGQLTRYRGAKVFFERLDGKATGGSRIDAEHNAVRRGSVQHEIIDGTRAMVFNNGDTLPIHVECMDDAQRLRAGDTVRYGLVVSIETQVATSTTVHDEVRAQLQARARAQARQRLQQ
jgi:hypothetical protein